MDNFIITTSYIATGMLLRRFNKFPADTSTSLNMFVIYVSLPALVLLKIREMQFSADALVPVFMPWIMLAVSGIMIISIARFFSWKREITGCLLLMIPLGNTSFLGIPMIKAFLGEQAISYAVLYDQLGSFLALAIYGSIILAFYGREEVKQSVRNVIIKIVTFPPFIALVIAMLSRYLTYPTVFLSILNSLSATLVPVVMIAVGFQLSIRMSRSELFPMAAGLGIKLVVAPAAALSICMLSSFHGESAKVAVMEAGMPPMVSAGALAIMAGLAPELTAALVGVGIVLCFATLPVLFEVISWIGL